MENKRIGIFGTGDVGRALGTGFVTLGSQVKMGARDAQNDKAAEWAQKSGPLASHGTFADAAAYGEILVLCTAWDAVENVLRLAGAENLAGKVLIDAANPLAYGPAGPTLAVGHTDSGGERVQRLVPTARVVKCFNIVGNQHMFRPDFPGGPPDMLIAGNDADAKHAVSEICHAFGWNVLDLGGIEASRYLEPFAMVWIVHFLRNKVRDHAFKLLRK